MFAFVIPFIEKYATGVLRSILVTMLVHQVDKTAKQLYAHINSSSWPWWLKSLATHALEAFVDPAATPENAADIAAATLKSWLGQMVAGQMAADADVRRTAFSDAEVLGHAAGSDPPPGMSLLAWMQHLAREGGVDLETVLELREIHRAGRENIT